MCVCVCVCVTHKGDSAQEIHEVLEIDLHPDALKQKPKS